MSDYILNIGDGEKFDPKPFLAGPWRSFQIQTIASGNTAEYRSDGVEHAIYIMSGRGRARSAAESFEVAAGTAITVPREDWVALEAHRQGLVLFICVLDAPPLAAG